MGVEREMNLPVYVIVSFHKKSLSCLQYADSDVFLRTTVSWAQWFSGILEQKYIQTGVDDVRTKLKKLLEKFVRLYDVLDICLKIKSLNFMPHNFSLNLMMILCYMLSLVVTKRMFFSSTYEKKDSMSDL